MQEKELYTIGQDAEICDVSKRMIRYYEKQGLILPDQIDSSNQYRYYSIETLRWIQIVRYLMDQGFQLGEIRDTVIHGDLQGFRDLIFRMIDKTKEEITYQSNRLQSLQQWGALILEGEQVLEHCDDTIQAVFFPVRRFLTYDTEYDSEARIETAFYRLSKQEGHTMVDAGGAFYYCFKDFGTRLDGNIRNVRIRQQLLPGSSSDSFVEEYGGFLTVRSYHIGGLKTIGTTYERIFDWCREHRFELRGDVIERHILDICSTQNEEEFITELILPVKEQGEQSQRLYDILGQI